MVPQMPAANAASSATNSSATGTRRLIGERRQPEERGLPSSRSVERGAEAIVRGGLALERADLRQQRRHVEVVGQALDLPTLDLEDLARGHLDALVRRRDRARRRLERARVDALPHDLENGGVPAPLPRRGPRPPVPERPLPAPPRPADSPDAPGAPPRPLF